MENQKVKDEMTVKEKAEEPKDMVRLTKRYEHYTPQILRSGINLPVETQVLTDVYGNSSWVYTCIFAIASHLAAVPIKFYRITEVGKKEDVPMNHPVYRTFAKPNPWMSWYDLMEGTMTFLEINGNGYWEIEPDEQGNPVNFYLLRSDRMRPVPHPKNRVRGYVYEPSLDSRIPFNPEQILQFRYFNPKSEVLGMSPMTAAIAALTSDFYAVGNMKDVFKNASRVEGVLEAEGTLSEGAYKRVKENWAKSFKGVGKTHRTAILEEGLKFHEVSLSPKDMEFILQRKFSREEILAVYGVPPVIVGLMEDTSWANAREQRREFWTGTLIPKGNKVESAINVELMPRLYEGIYMEFDLKGITALSEDLEKQATRLSNLVSRGILTINDARRIMGYKEVPWGDTYWTPANLVPFQTAEQLNSMDNQMENELTETGEEVETEEEMEQEEKGFAWFNNNSAEGDFEYEPGDELPALAAVRAGRKTSGR